MDGKVPLDGGAGGPTPNGKCKIKFKFFLDAFPLPLFFAFFETNPPYATKPSDVNRFLLPLGLTVSFGYIRNTLMAAIGSHPMQFRF